MRRGRMPVRRLRLLRLARRLGRARKRRQTNRMTWIWARMMSLCVMPLLYRKTRRSRDPRKKNVERLWPRTTCTSARRTL
ncbi:hypothetical protein H310_12831 [Aphanomyces invadans]|uniref:Uncharacterized protein n=1 Tax=Aphanomyces invadans TaxID=157072 RepID=A0A024TG32_9STRA|nr:hypothetical protein H310_12831 [Aphanomyces invadans]ETV92993.1 hypothetical protein H310_12831 [Aphanomyces invadans]|eukprot:XP_008878258.1 hypothetical protein H310_12831 [Aphanomyces invadans]